MLKSKISERVQEVILPDFPDDENTVPTVTKSRRVSFGTNFVKEFIVGSAVSGQCMPEYEQAFPSSDSSTADSSHSGAESGLLEHSMFVSHESHKIHKSVPPTCQPPETDFMESRPKLPKFSSTVCFSADSPTADMEFTEGCITLAKSILDKKNKEMTVIIQAKPKDEEKPKEEETKYFDGSQFEMSMTRCLKSKGNKREEKRFESEKTKIFSKYENEMSITRCNRIFNEDDSDGSWEDCKENRMPLDMIMRHLDKDNSDLENDLFNPEKTLGNIFSADPLDLTNESEKLNLNESMDISTDFQSRGPRNFSQNAVSPEDLRKSLQRTGSQESSEFLTPLPVEKSLVGAATNDRMDKTTEEMSLDDAEPFRQPQSPPDAQSTDSKMNTPSEQKVSQESEEVLTPEKEQSMVDPPIIEDKSNKSTQQMSLEVGVEPSLPEKEPFAVEPTVTDQIVTESVNELEEVMTCEREPSLLDLPSEEVELNKSEERMSLDGFQGGVSPEKGTTAAADQPSDVHETSKSSERMSLDGSNEVRPCEIAESLTDPPGDDRIEKSAQRTSLDGTEGILTCEREQSLMELTSTDRIIQSTEQNLEDLPSAVQEVVDLPEEKMIDLPSAEPSLGEVEEVLPTETEPSPIADRRTEGNRLSEVKETPTSEREPSLVDLKVIESLKEQSKEAGCVWSLKDLRHPQTRTLGSLSFSCRLLETSTSIHFALKVSNEDSLVACSIVTNSDICLNEEKQFRLPEYRLVLDFGFGELKKYFEQRRAQVETIRHVPYFLDQINSFMARMNAYLRQIHSILTMYPGSRLEGSRLSFRLFSFPIFFSCMVSIDLSNIFRLSKSSLSFEIDFGSLDENRIREIFQDCLKCEDSLCEFVVRSTKYLVALERQSGYVSKRGHIRLLPAELKL